MLIHVSQGDIDNGTPRTCGFCPVARALHRATGEIWIVYEDAARPWLGDPWVRVPLPPGVAERIRRYDAGQGMEPFSFELDWQPAG